MKLQSVFAALIAGTSMLTGVVSAQTGYRVAQTPLTVPLDGRELERELVNLLLHGAAALDVDSTNSALVKALDENGELVIEHLAGFGLRRIETERGAPGLAAIALLQVAEELDEAGDEIDLREEHVDWQRHLEGVLHLVDARPNLGAGGLDGLLVRVEELIDADRDDDAVDGLLGAVGVELL